MPISETRRAEHLDWLTSLTSIPTATGHEHHVVAWIERWLADRPDLASDRDQLGNMTISMRDAPTSDRPLLITAHLDHPAFHVETADGTHLELTFRGGVMDDYFENGRIIAHTRAGDRIPGVLRAKVGQQEPLKRFSAEMDAPGASAGDFATWDLPPASIENGILHTPVCDDLAAAVAALAALDELRLARARGETIGDVRLLFTLAEEVGFVGAIGACKLGTIPPGSRLIALENSRAMPEAPIGAGPIVRVGDRLTIFTPELTRAVDLVCERIAGGPPPTAQQKLADGPKWKWQRKLMAGGACEATAFCAYGFEATCICLPLGNYHNMGDIDEVQAGRAASAAIDREFISIADFEGLVDLLIGCGQDLPESGSMIERLERLWDERRFVLNA